MKCPHQSTNPSILLVTFVKSKEKMISTIKTHSPKTLAEAYAILQQERTGIKVLAGGTDLMVTLNARVEQHPAYLNIWNLAELRGISESHDAIRIGALTTYTQMIRSALVQQHAPILIEAAKLVGATQIQNRGTLGGNIVNASPAGDTLPVLAVLDAVLEVGSAQATRKIAFNEFYTGYRKTELAPEELLLAIYLPKSAKTDWQYFRKVGTRQAQAISKIVLALRAQKTAEHEISSIKIAYGSVAPTVIRAPRTEALLNGKQPTEELIELAKQTVMQEVRPITDVRSTENYRRLVSGNILKRALYEFWQSA